MESREDTTKTNEIENSFGVNKWKEKKNRYEIDKFIGLPPSDEPESFLLHFGKPSQKKISTSKKKSTPGPPASESPLIGRYRNRTLSIGESGGAISVDALNRITFEDYSKQPELPSPPSPKTSISDLTLETQLFPQADPLIVLPWRRRLNSLYQENLSTSEISSMTFTSDTDSVERTISQAVKDFNITAKEVSCVDKANQEYENITFDNPIKSHVDHQHVDKTKQDCGSIILDNSVTSHADHLQDNKASPPRVRKRSGLEDYVASVSKPKDNTIYPLENECSLEEEEEKEEEEARRVRNDNKSHTESFNQNIEIIHQNHKPSLNDEYNHFNNTNEKDTEEQNNDMLYEPYIPLQQLEPPDTSDIRNKETQIASNNENNADHQEAKYELKSQEAVNCTKIEGKARKLSLLRLAAPFIPFKDSFEKDESPVTPTEVVNEQKSTSKAASRFLYTGENEHNSEQLKNTEISNSDDLHSSSKRKVRKRRPKPSALREMNVWGPSSM